MIAKESAGERPRITRVTADAAISSDSRQINRSNSARISPPTDARSSYTSAKSRRRKTPFPAIPRGFGRASSPPANSGAHDRGRLYPGVAVDRSGNVDSGRSGRAGVGPARGDPRKGGGGARVRISAPSGAGA